MTSHQLSIHNLATLSRSDRAALMLRAESSIATTIDKVMPIIEDVRQRGDEALVHYAAAFDRASIRASDIKVTPEEFDEAENQLDDAVKAALSLAAENVRHFHRLQMPDGLQLHETAPGVIVGDRWTSIDSVACYVPRGKGSFPSSVLMTAIPAKVANVGRVIIITPPGPDGKVDAATLVAARIAGVNEVYKCGGAQAIAAVAFGTATIPACKKVVGPGSSWVAAAKKALASVIDPGSPAGPSELIVFSDGSVPPELAALDLCVESEHGPDSSAYLVTTSEDYAREVAAHMPSLWQNMSEERASYSQSVLCGSRGGIVIAQTTVEAFDFINDYAPEHLAVLAQDAWGYLPLIRNAGEILLGPHSAIAVANFVLGPSHVLPTGGAAATSSPLSVFDFMKRTSIASVGSSAFANLAPYAESIARYEGFDAHANSISKQRFQWMNGLKP